MIYTTFNFSSFNYYDKPIILPPNTVFYRGIPNGKNIPNLDILRKEFPIYLGSDEISKAYCSGENDLCIKIANKDFLKLVDIRKIINMLPMILNMIPYKQENKQIIDILKLTLGICSLSEQMHIISNYNISYEKRKRLIDFHNKERNINTGIRIPVTDADSLMIQIMKSIFGNYYDGIISPRLKTVYETNGFSHEEIIIFDTKKLYILENNENVEKLHINKILNEEMIFKIDNVLIGGKYGYQDKNLHLTNDEKFIKKTKKFAKLLFPKKQRTEKNIKLNFEQNIITRHKPIGIDKELLYKFNIN